ALRAAFHDRLHVDRFVICPARMAGLSQRVSGTAAWGSFGRLQLFCGLRANHPAYRLLLLAEQHSCMDQSLVLEFPGAESARDDAGRFSRRLSWTAGGLTDDHLEVEGQAAERHPEFVDRGTRRFSRAFFSVAAASASQLCGQVRSRYTDRALARRVAHDSRAPAFRNWSRQLYAHERTLPGRQCVLRNRDRKDAGFSLQCFSGADCGTWDHRFTRLCRHISRYLRLARA